MSWTIYTIVFVIGIPLASLRSRFRVVLWSYFWSVLFLLPVSNIIPLGFQAREGLLFVPSIGLVAIVIILISRLLVMHNSARVIAGFCLIVVAGIWFRDTSRRLPVWKDDAALFSTMIKETPGLPDAYAGLARALSRTMPDSAISLFNRAILIDQGLVPAHIHLATLYRQKRDYRRAIHHLRLADELLPDSPRIQTELGFSFLYSGQLDSARAAFERALSCNAQPGAEVPVSKPPSEPLIGLGLTIGLMGRFETMDTVFSRPGTQFPGWRDSIKIIINQLVRTLGEGERGATHITHLGRVVLQLGDSVAAEEYYRKALTQAPFSVPALYNLALLLRTKGEYAEAQDLIDRALRLCPNVKEFQQLSRMLRSSQQHKPRTPPR